MQICELRPKPPPPSLLMRLQMVPDTDSELDGDIEGGPDETAARSGSSGVMRNSLSSKQGLLLFSGAPNANAKTRLATGIAEVLGIPGALESAVVRARMLDTITAFYNKYFIRREDAGLRFTLSNCLPAFDTISSSRQALRRHTKTFTVVRMATPHVHMMCAYLYDRMTLLW